MKTTKISLVIVSASMAAGCTNGTNPPLLFGQTHTVGITINGSTTTQGAELTLGYRDYDIAIVPTTVTDGSGTTMQLRASAKDGGAEAQDALSVLGQFDVNSGSAPPQAGLGKFFATGLAAKTLADGFAKRLEK